jgi:hypothetical protein
MGEYIMDIVEIVEKFEADEKTIAEARTVFEDYERGVIQDKLQGFDRLRAILEGE